MSDPKSLGTEYPREQARCRELLAAYERIGPVGAFGKSMIEGVLREADTAAASGDLPAMIRAYKKMEGCK